MSTIQWSDSLSVGVETIDSEHKRLIKIANAILKIARENPGTAKLVNALSYLREYTVVHFANEESFMESIKYQDLLVHCQEHAELKKRVKEYQSKLYHADAVSESEVLLFLKHWLVDHVLGCDMKIRMFISDTKTMESNKIEDKVSNSH